MNKNRGSEYSTVQKLRLIALFLIFPSVASSQQAATESPVEAVRRFNALLNNGDLVTLCRMIAEPDGSGPLKPANFERTQTSFAELMKMWMGRRVTYDRVIFPVEKDSTKAQVIVSIIDLRQEARFTLLRHQEAWLILDIEVFFR